MNEEYLYSCRIATLFTLWRLEVIVDTTATEVEKFKNFQIFVFVKKRNHQCDFLKSFRFVSDMAKKYTTVYLMQYKRIVS